MGKIMKKQFKRYKKREELRRVMMILYDYESRVIDEYYDSFEDENRENKVWGFDVEGEKVLVEFINELKKIKPYSDKESIKKNPKRISPIEFISSGAQLNYMYYLIQSKQYIANKKWRDAINSIINLEHSYDILKEKIYYSLINIL